MRRTAVLVGAGYLGRRLGRRLLGEGYAVRGMTRSPEHARELMALGVVPLLGDVTCPETLPPALEGATHVFHLLGAMRGEEAALRLLHVEGTGHVLAALPPGLSRYVYVSSTAVYGQTEGEWVDETAVCEPTSLIGRLRCEAEALILKAHREREVPAVILRSGSIYRPGSPVNAQIREGRYRVSTDPSKWMNHIYIEDFLGGLLVAAERGRAGEIYNLVDDEPHPGGTYFVALAEAMGVPAPPVTFTPPEEGCGALVRESNKRCANRKLKTQCGWSPAFPTCRDGIRHAAARGFTEAPLP
ncbi:MAG: NAD-dependent epimerase/dehydratase family protein [Gemmatimonadetes bacterium]|nr:NAD-dependent epimerase/dehydratase family protein [Gemmatimonadota bacterium]